MVVEVMERNYGYQADSSVLEQAASSAETRGSERRHLYSFRGLVALSPVYSTE